MKNAIKEYLTLSEEDKKELWKSAVFVFDTNIFLNLYRYTEDTRNTLLDAMQQLSERIWMPKQVAQEIMKDRAKVIFDTLKIFNDLQNEKENFINNCIEKLRREKDDEKITKMSQDIDEHIQILKKESNYIENIDRDEILNRLLQMYDKKVGNGFSGEQIEEIKKDGEKRYEKLIPPGFKDFKKGEDNNSFGDLIIWKEILSFAKENENDIIYITGDKKEDWWNKVNGRTLGPRVELKKEFFEETNQKFYMYSMESFLVHYKEFQGTQIHQSAIDEVENYQKQLEKRQQFLIKKSRHRRIEDLANERSHLMMAFQDLNEQKEGVQDRIKELKHIIDTKNHLTPENLNSNDIEMLNRFSTELKYNLGLLDEIEQKKLDIQKDIEKITHIRNTLIHSLERREKDFD